LDHGEKASKLRRIFVAEAALLASLLVNARAWRAYVKSLAIG